MGLLVLDGVSLGSGRGRCIRALAGVTIGAYTVATLHTTKMRSALPANSYFRVSVTIALPDDAQSRAHYLAIGLRPVDADNLALCFRL